MAMLGKLFLLALILTVDGNDLREAFPEVASILISPLNRTIKIGMKPGEKVPEDLISLGCYIAAEGGSPLPFTLIIEIDEGNQIMLIRKYLTSEDCNAEETQRKVLIIQKLLRKHKGAEREI